MEIFIICFSDIWNFSLLEIPVFHDFFLHLENSQDLKRRNIAEEFFLMFELTFVPKMRRRRIVDCHITSAFQDMKSHKDPTDSKGFHQK